MRALADRLANERRRLDELRAGNLAVRTSFEVSFASLPDSATFGGADPARAFRLLGLWTGPSISLAAAAALFGVPEETAAGALDVLIDAHLLESPAPDRYRFHDLLRVYATDRALSEETEKDRLSIVTRLLTWYLHTTAAASRVIAPQHSRVPLDTLPPERRPLSFSSLTECLDWAESERPGLLAATQLAAAFSMHEFAWKLPAAAMSFYYRRGHLDDWVATHETGLASARALGDRHAEAWMLNNLGMAHGTRRSEESVAYFEEALSLSRETGDIVREARVANNLANAYLDLGRYDEATQAATNAVDLDKRSGDRYGEGIAREVLGCARRELGHPGDALNDLQHALAIYRELDAHAHTADALSELGGTYLSLGQVADAITYLRQSLNIQREIGDLPHLAATLHRLGKAQIQAREPSEAHKQFDEALQLYETLGDIASADGVRSALASLNNPSTQLGPR